MCAFITQYKDLQPQQFCFKIGRHEVKKCVGLAMNGPKFQIVNQSTLKLIYHTLSENLKPLIFVTDVFKFGKKKFVSEHLGCVHI